MKRRRSISGDIAFMEDIFESYPVGVLILDAEGKVLMMNRQQEQISRVSRDNVIGAYFHDAWKRLFDQGTYGNKYWELLNKGKPFTLIFSEVVPQFYEVKVSGVCHGAPLSSGRGFILLHDLSEQLGIGKRALEQLASQLAESTEFLGSLIDSSPNVVLTADEDGFIRSGNKMAEEIFGYSRGEFYWKHISQLFMDPSKIQEHLSNTCKGIRLESLCKKSGGSTFPARIQINDIVQKENRGKLKLFLLSDISREKAMEERLVLSEKLANFSELMAGIAHQLNNPLVGVVNFASLLLDRISPDDPNRKLVETISQAAVKCQRLLASMIKGIREPASTFHLVNVNEVLQSALQTAWQQSSAGSSKVVLRKRVRVELPMIYGDSLQLHEVLRNLIINALQAMPQGGMLDIGVKHCARKKEMKIWCRDTGHGISKKDLSRIFTPFFSTKKNTGGGLGLSFAHQVIKSHAGRIIVRSSPGRGSTFIVVLPIPNEENRLG